MAKTLGYLITWTTYGTWLQGDERGYARKGKVYSGSEGLSASNRFTMSRDAVILKPPQRKMAHQAIMREAFQQNHRILALAVQHNHVHIVFEFNAIPISRIVAQYKTAARIALKETGLTGRVWTKGYDKRYCFEKSTLADKIKYVNNHDNSYFAI